MASEWCSANVGLKTMAAHDMVNNMAPQHAKLAMPSRLHTLHQPARDPVLHTAPKYCSVSSVPMSLSEVHALSTVSAGQEHEDGIHELFECEKWNGTTSSTASRSV